MAEKLKSISGRIHWSLLIKAGAFGIAWTLLPFPLFLILALLFYFIPAPHSGNVAGPFLVLLVLCGVESRGAFFAIVFGALFYYLLAIKGLLVIDRKSGYEIIVLTLSFLLFRLFYLRLGGAMNAASLSGAFVTASLFGVLMANFADCFKDEAKGRVPARAMSWLSLLLMWQFLVAGLFLPLDFTYQSVIVFLLAVLIVDLLPQHLFSELTRTKLLLTSSVVFSLLVLVLGSARWGL